MESGHWDFLAVRYAAVSRALALQCQREPDLYGVVVEGAYCFQDMMLGRLLQLAGPETTFIVLSERPGLFAMAGPNIRHDELVFGGRLVDLVPTLLAIFGLPAGADMRGRVLVEAFREPVEPARIPTWEPGPGEPPAPDAPDISAAIRQLAALGYSERIDGQALRELEAARAEEAFTLGCVHLFAGHAVEAIAPFEEAIRRGTERPEAEWYLAQAYIEAGRAADARDLVERALAGRPDHPYANLLRANLAIAERDFGRALASLRLADECPRQNPTVRLLVGRVNLALRQWDAAERAFREALADDAGALAHAGLAEALLGRGADREAAGAALDAIAIDFDLPAAHHALGVALSRMGETRRAEKAFAVCRALRPATGMA
jgi:Tfp pilus assembly protein PilF